MAIRDGVDVGVLALLVGAELPKGVKMHRQLACGILGTGIGALVDAGFTDEQINDVVAAVLGQIRTAMASGDPMGALADELRKPRAD
jgi:hypothetical protein